MRICSTKIICCLMAALTMTNVSPCSTSRDIKSPEAESVSQTERMKIKITAGSQTLTADLEDNPAARDFRALLPLTVKVEDYAHTEKIFYPSKKLSADNAGSGAKAGAGDIMYYAPWGNIAIFYKDFGYAQGLIKLGHINGDIQVLKVSGSIDKVRFEPIE